MEKIIICTEIQNGLLNGSQPCHTSTDEYNGMSLTDFIKKFRWFNVKYPDKDNRKQFLIELRQEDCVITCKMIDNICVGTYIIEND
ncbi:hypothetical protein [Dysgonomonas termitidis]|uniref:Uncharacterized protein n=1 Tax=Dysgonomonas termitidis TaxID=1516126 RepID=A0ABV9KSW5_9BACT